ncbi:MAG: hypothetical protein ACT4PT_12510 [Methanobacteriota archaeon]
MNRDTVIGIAGAAILVAAMAAVFYYEGTNAPTGLGGDGEIVTSSVTVGDLSGSLGEGETANEAVNVSQHNLTKVEFVLTWSDDDNTDADSFTLRVTSPGGVSREASGDSGTVTVTFDGVNPTPNGTAVHGMEGLGEWQVEVTLDSAGDGPAGAPIQPIADDGNAWSLEAKGTAYETRAA